MKRILGLDLGTSSVGWAVVDQAENENEKSQIIKRMTLKKAKVFLQQPSALKNMACALIFNDINNVANTLSTCS